MRTLPLGHPGIALVAVVIAAVAGAACGSAAAGAAAPGTVRPGAHVDSGAAPAAQESARPATAAYTDADVRFMQDMIVHHAQALVMTALVPDRSERRDIRTLARRIELSQEDEIALMRRWLERRGEAAPDPGHSHHGDDDASAGPPGMLTHAELARLARASGGEFDRLFLEYMIHHHEGALAMVAELMATDGAAQDVEVFKFAAHVEADQHAEIARMRGMLNALSHRG